ncbi:MAG TPA: CheR family methyltransferase [Gemmatimonadaceae bacterium]|nr:CheR family methyltransferase [Gemmatimonadaceae bacterium]
MNALLEYLKCERGVDFTRYRKASVQRRIEKRMHELGVGTFPDYQSRLESDVAEMDALLKAGRVKVTSFFRDPDTWTFLADRALPALLGRAYDVRVWSAGCSSGEEAYTIAILLAEALGFDDFRARVTMYATDVDEEGLTSARSGVYSRAELADLPSTLRDKYFDFVGETYVVRNILRRQITFGRHDLTVDAPISDVDLLVCRNAVIYMDAKTQAAVLSNFHSALRPGGILVLGAAETVATHSADFEPLDAQRGIAVKPAGARTTQDSVEPARHRPQTVRVRSSVAQAQRGSAKRERGILNGEMRRRVDQLEIAGEARQAANEALQAANDDLTAANDELRDRSAELTGTNAFLETVLASLEGAVIVVDARLDIVAWNRKALQLWGLPEHDVVGRNLMDLDIGVPVESLRDALQRVVGGATDAHAMVDVSAVNVRGRSMTCRISMSRFQHPDGVGGRHAILLMEDAEGGVAGRASSA